MWLEARRFFTYRIKLPMLARVLIFLRGDEFALTYYVDHYNISNDLNAFLAFYSALPPQAKAYIDRTIEIISEEANNDEMESWPWEEVRKHPIRTDKQGNVWVTMPLGVDESSMELIGLEVEDDDIPEF